MKRFFAAIALCLFGTFAQAENTGLQRLGSENEARVWQGVGRLELAGRGFCTATLIAPDTILTAAHCVYDTNTGAAHAPRDLVFRAGLLHGKAVATRRVSKIAAHAGFDPLGEMDQQNVTHDVALLRLEKPIPSNELNWFALHSDAVKPSKVSVVSYGRGREDAQSRQKECKLIERQDDVLAFDCDVTFGSSGAPVFSHLNGQRGRILSVISGIVTVKGKKIALGMYLPPLIAELKPQLRSAVYTPPKARIKRLTVGSSGTTLNSGMTNSGTTRNSGTGAKFIKVPGS